MTPGKGGKSHEKDPFCPILGYAEVFQIHAELCFLFKLLIKEVTFMNALSQENWLGKDVMKLKKTLMSGIGTSVLLVPN